MADKITAKILRYDPSVDDEPHYETYETEWEDDPSGFMTGLQVLNKIDYETEAFGHDYNCRGGLCGRCAMVIDGKPGLACWTPLQPGEHTFEPLNGFPVIKDLIVDKSEAYERIVGVDISTKTVDPIVNLKNIDHDLYWNKLEKMNMCRECMMCYSVCPMVRGEAGQFGTLFVGPGAMMGIAQRYLDTRDESDRLAQAVFSGLFECIGCGMCQNVCAAKIPITEIIADMQADAEARGLKPTSDASFM